MSDEYIGASTDFLYVWDEVYGWINCSEKEKLVEAYKRFCDSMNGTNIKGGN